MSDITITVEEPEPVDVIIGGETGETLQYKITVSNTPPPNPDVNDIWIDTT